MTYAFVRFDAGAGQPHRHKRADCTVRALATAKGIDYGDAWNLLYELQGKKRHCHFDLFHYLRKMPHEMGVLREFKYRAVRGLPRVKVRDFVVAHPLGRYIVQSAGHASAVLDGRLIDTWDCGRKAVYGAWEMKKGGQ